MDATVIVKNDHCSGEYEMFDVRSIDAQGALLHGPLFLEVGETLHLRVAKGSQVLELEARVDAITDEGMKVQFVALDAYAKKLLSA